MATAVGDVGLSREGIVDVFPAHQGIVGSFGGNPKLFDILFTDRRLIGIVRGSMPGFLEGAIYFAVKQRKLQGNPTPYRTDELDAAVAKDSKSFSIPYSAIKKTKVSGMVGSKSLVVMAPGFEAYLYFPKDELGRLDALLSRFVPSTRA